jgi:hypothetical protein
MRAVSGIGEEEYNTPARKIYRKKKKKTSREDDYGDPIYRGGGALAMTVFDFSFLSL